MLPTRMNPDQVKEYTEILDDLFDSWFAFLSLTNIHPTRDPRMDVALELQVKLLALIPTEPSA